MKHMIIGTAGHIDHGKTTLIKALTGRDTDRLAEEKRRGITIDLGFTYFDLPNGERAGIVDVPGHEKFLGNMTAGVTGMDLVLVVIAADEGMMPQTREHLDIINLLGVKKVILVLNKCDLADEEWQELVEEEIREELKESPYANAPMVKVSARTGVGLEELTEVIVCEGQTAEARDVHTISRLPIDRVFSLPGIGTVAAGTLLSGILQKDMELMCYPGGKLCRIRSLQTYGEETDRAEAGQRVAVNLPNLKKDQIARGQVLASVSSMKETTLLDVKLTLLKSSGRRLVHNSRLHFYTGTGEILCRAALLDREELLPGKSGYVQLRLEAPAAVRQGDRFVVRFYSPMETIGGGVILDPNPHYKKRFRQEVIEELKSRERGSSMDMVELKIREQRELTVTTETLATLTALSKEEVLRHLEILASMEKVILFPRKKDVWVCHSLCLGECYERVKKALLAYEQNYPYRRGMKKAELIAANLGSTPPGAASMILERWETEGKLRLMGESVCRAGFAIVRDALFQKVETHIKNTLEKAAFEFVPAEELFCPEISGEVQEDIQRILKEDGDMELVTEEIYTLREYLEQAKERIEEMLSLSGIITISQVRDEFHTSRKCAKQLLEYTDRKRITRKTESLSQWTSF